MSRRTLLSAEARSRLFGIPTDRAEMARHYALDEEDLALIHARRRAANRLGFAVQLCLLRHPGAALGPGAHPPAPMLAFVAEQLGVPPVAFADYAERDQTRREHGAELQVALRLRSFRLADWRGCLRVGAEAAWATDRGEAIVAAMLVHLRREGVVVPGAAVLERIGLAARARARRLALARLTQGIGNAERAALDAVLKPDPALRGRSRLVWLRDAPQAPGPTNILALLDRLEWVRALGVGAGRTGRIHPARLARLVEEGGIITAQHLADLEPTRRAALLVAGVAELRTRLADATLAMFGKYTGLLFTKARNRDDRRFEATRRDVSRTLLLFRRTIAALQQAREVGEEGVAAVEREVGMARLADALPVIDAAAGVAEPEILVTVAERYAVLRRFVPRFLAAFEFRSSIPQDPLLAAIEIIKVLDRDGTRALPPRPPSTFLPPRWRKLIFAGETPDRRLYETAVLAILRDRLRGADIWVAGTRNHQAFEGYLLPAAAAAVTSAIDGEADPERYVAARSALLHERLTEVADLAARGALDGVEIEEGGLTIARAKPAVPDEARLWADRLYGMLPRVRVTEVMADVERTTGFAACFTHFRTGRPAADLPALLAAVLADGTNLGLSRMADATRGLTYHHLVNLAQWHINEDNYAAARAVVVEAQHQHPIAAVWGDGTDASSDGQYFRAGGRAGPGGDVNAKYGIDPGVVLYTHHSGRYAPMFSRVIAATAGEAPYVLDGLHPDAHRTSIRIAEHYTDTAGATDHVFGLCHLLGYSFAPRIRDLRERKLYAVEKPGRYPLLEPLLGDPVNTAAIVQGWAELLRVKASIEAGAVAPSAILRRLAAAGAGNALSRALRAIGRIERTLFVLRWLSDPALRQRSHAGLNKGEASNALRRAVFFHRQGEFRDRTFENQSFRASGLSLLTAAIIHWNTMYLDLAVKRLRAAMVTVPDEMLAHVAPLGWEHISLTGDYDWSAALPPPGGLRPLRDVRAPFITLAA
ncbi:Tn3 family transposase [Dankookia sp. GCM10030260]|uniref:Tn3 family transposase n=1 Tax=Dankookia sp. GCM10030260 TaxID=3273390 RepID=UPI00361B2E3B